VASQEAGEKVKSEKETYQMMHLLLLMESRERDIKINYE
jgi:hypothetical protein